MAEKIDSNVTGAAFAEEITPRVLPGGPVWYGLEPNSYSDFGGDVKMVARDTINSSRQRQKGSAVDLDASGGFQQDFTKTNSLRLLRSFFFARFNTLFGTESIDAVDGITPRVVTAIDAATNKYTINMVGAGLTDAMEGTLLFASGFAKPANNGLSVLIEYDDTFLQVSRDLIAEAVPATADLVSVGFQFAAGDLVLDAFAGGLTLTSTAIADMAATTKLRVGAWVFIGDGVGTSFDIKGYARVSDIAGPTITFDKATANFVDNAGAGLTVRLFYGRYIRNEEDSDLIKAFTIQLERTLGRDADGVMSQYLPGSYGNEFTLNIPTAEKLTAEMAFVSIDDEQRTGLVGPKAGTRVKAPGENLINTSSDVYRLRLSIIDPTTVNPTPLFGYVTEAKLMIKNNITPAKAVGVFGAFDMTVGGFEVSGNITAYFSKVEAVQAVRNSADVSFDMIIAKDNAGFIFDMPLLGLGGGRLSVEKDAPVTLPLDLAAAENVHGYTLSGTFFPYLPSSAMPLR